MFWLKRVHKASNQQQAIGIVRLCAMKSHNAGWLIRGLWIAPEHRRKGYASQLMQFAIEIINSKRQHLLFAIADKQLERLYQQLNFLPLAVNDTCVPADIKLHFKQPKSQEKWQIWRLEKTP